MNATLDLDTDTASNALELAYAPRQWAVTVHQTLAGYRFVVCIAHRRAGKTWVACASLIFAALANPKTAYAYVAPTRVQAKQITWAIFKHILEPLGGSVEFFEGELNIKFPNGSTIGLFSGEHHDALRGSGFHGIVVDEIANIGPDAWYGSIRPTLAGTGGWALFIGTPAGADLLAELYQYALYAGDPEWASLRFPAYPENSTGVLPEAEIAAARREAISEATFMREFGVSLDVSAEDQLVKLQDVVACQSRVIPVTVDRDPKMARFSRVIGVDVGGGAADGDNAVIARRWGPIVYEPIVVPPERQDDLAFTLNRVAREFDADAIFVDATGGWASHLIPTAIDLGMNVIPVNFANKAQKEAEYYNRRAEMHAELAKWTKQNSSVLPPGQKLASDLTATRFTFDAKGRIQLEKKKDVRARLGRSPDIADAIALTFAAPIPARSRQTLFDTDMPRSTGRVHYHDANDRTRGLRREVNGYGDFDPFEDY